MLELRVANGDLLRRAVAPLIEIDDDKGIVKYGPNGVSLSTAWDQEVFIYAMLIIRPFNSDNNPFRCNNSRVAGIDLNEVYDKLILQYEESSITIHADDGEEVFYFIFRLADEGGNIVTRYEAMELKEANNEHADPEIYLDREYEGVIGIFSEDFVEILRYLGEASDEAIINIGNGQVKFTTETDRNVIRRTERNECFIGGLGEADEFEVNIDIPPLEAFRKASLVSTMVWMLFSDEVPLALNFPVDAIGNIMFYFA